MPRKPLTLDEVYKRDLKELRLAASLSLTEDEVMALKLLLTQIRMGASTGELVKLIQKSQVLNFARKLERASLTIEYQRQRRVQWKAENARRKEREQQMREADQAMVDTELRDAQGDSDDREPG